MIVVGLTGGIGSGKSTVSRLLAERGAVVIDADSIVHELQRPGAPLLDAIADRFGSEVITDDGRLDRARLAQLAFADDESVKALNAIVHPAVAAEMSARVAALAHTDQVVVLDIPLLKEKRDGMVAVVVVDTPVDVAVARLVEHRGMREQDARARAARQMSRSERLALADHVIDNAGDAESLRRQVDELWTQLRALPAKD